MKYRIGSLLLLGGFLVASDEMLGSPFPNSDVPSDSFKVFPSGVSECGSTGRHFYNYFVFWNQFPMKYSWIPGGGAFPFNLWHEADRNQPKIKLSTGEQIEINLDTVNILPLRLFEKPIAHGLTVRDFENQWFVMYNWTITRSTAHGSIWGDQYKVILLDGTAAVKLPDMKSDAKFTNWPCPHDKSIAPQSPESSASDARWRERQKVKPDVDLNKIAIYALKWNATNSSGIGSAKITQILLHFGPRDSFEAQTESEALDRGAVWFATVYLTRDTSPYKEISIEIPCGKR